ncbi:MAG: cache domain-containing protein [Rubrivivax sp.]|nr:cache domain-containing protein [Rubrivivax sp.]
MRLFESFRHKIALLIGTTVLGMAVLAAISFWQLREQMLEARQREVTVAVQLGHAIVDAFQKKAASGAMTVAEAQKAAVEALRVARYGDTGADYYYIYTLDGVNVLLPSKPEWAGQNMIGKVKDAHGADVIQSLVTAAARSPDGWAFVESTFPRPGSTVAVPKLQRLSVVKEWNWMIGSGLYLDDVQAQVRATLLKTLGMAAAIITALGLMGVLIARAVLRQIGGEPEQAMQVMQQVAAGNLSVSVPHSDARSLLGALDATVVSLRRIVGEVRQSTDSIATASSQIATGSLDLSARTEQAASSLQQTAAAMEQLTGTVASTSTSARQANDLACQASATAQQGSTVVGEVVATMDTINDSSRKIADIIGVIDGIAFQTNILALNAAVEAARAGEQGRGFAVVAAEVRTLAQRSAQAAKEIKALITESVDRVQRGSDLVGQAGASMSELVERVQRVGRIVDEITSAAGEQSGGIAQVNQAVADLDRATQQNAALVEESNAAAESLKFQARSLSQTMAVFRL